RIVAQQMAHRTLLAVDDGDALGESAEPDLVGRGLGDGVDPALRQGFGLRMFAADPEQAAAARIETGGPMFARADPQLAAAVLEQGRDVLAGQGRAALGPETLHRGAARAHPRQSIAGPDPE